MLTSRHDAARLLLILIEIIECDADSDITAVIMEHVYMVYGNASVVLKADILAESKDDDGDKRDQS